MSRRLICRFPFPYLGTREGTTTPWPPGEEREVPDETAGYLLGDFPGLFIEVSRGEVVAPAMASPPADRMIKPPRRRVQARR